MSKKFNKLFLSDELFCKNHTMLHFKKECSFFDESLSFYLEVFDKIQGDKKIKFSAEEGAIILLNIRMLRSLFCSNALIKTGYYTESRTLQRSIHETHYLCKYFNKNPAAIKNWLKGKRIEHSKVTDDLNLSSNVKKLYNSLCDYTHPNLPIILDIVSSKNLIKDVRENKEKNMESVHIGSVYNEDTAYTLIITQLLLLQMIIDNFEDFFVKHNRIELTDPYLKKHNALHKKFFNFLDNWNKYAESIT